MMPTEELITCAYVMTQEEREFKLEYYIVSEAAAHHSRSYGISIKKYNPVLIESASVTLWKNKTDALQVIDRFARNFVFPCSLGDLVEDLH